MTTTESLKKPIITRVVAGSTIILIGVISMLVLANMKEPPAEIQVNESKIRVETLTAQLEDVEVTIKGFGEVIALKTVDIAPEVSGKLVKVHPLLEIGQIITKDEILFEIDSQDYQAAFEEAYASVLQTKNTITRLKKEFEISKTRLKTLVRNKDLAKAEFERNKRLYNENGIGTQTEIDKLEQSYNTTSDQVMQLNQSITTYPLVIKESEYSLRSANARLARAKANLNRCVVKAPFSGRLKTVSVEAGQYVSPGQTIVSMVDDSVSEIHIPLDSIDAQKWLRFNTEEKQDQAVWFRSLQALPVVIRWTEDTDGHTWEGIMDRVINYDKQTRTLTVAIRVEEPISLTNGMLPLVEGMFCEVAIPGKVMTQVVRLPRWAVSFRNAVFIANDNRLKTIPVEVARIQNDEVFVKSGITPGDQVITTRLVDPLENSLLEIITP